MSHEELIKHLKGVRQIVINAQHGGFSLSDEATELYLNKIGANWTIDQSEDSLKYQSLVGNTYLVDGELFFDREIARDDPVLVAVVKEMGEAANGRHAELKIVDIPADVKWQIDEYDGWEWVAEQHRTWS